MPPPKLVPIERQATSAAVAAVAAVEQQEAQLASKIGERSDEQQQRNADMTRLGRALRKPLPPDVVARLAREKTLGKGPGALLQEFIDGGGTWGIVIAKEQRRHEQNQSAQTQKLWKMKFELERDYPPEFVEKVLAAAKKTKASAG
eukprot:6270076-Alexandrium_andersonii.AAC.1